MEAILQAPHCLECARASLTKAFSSSSTRFVSLKRMDMPKISPYTGAFRTVFDVKTSKETVRMAFDIIYVGAEDGDHAADHDAARRRRDGVADGSRTGGHARRPDPRLTRTSRHI